MKKVHILFCAVAAISLLALLLVFGAGLLRFGWVEIPYPDVVSVKITNTLCDGFQFEVTDPYHIETLTKALDDLGPMVNTPETKTSNGSLYFLQLVSSDGRIYSIRVQDKNHLSADKRCYSADLNEIIGYIESFEGQARTEAQRELSDLLHRGIQEGESEGLAQELASSFTNSPKNFVQCLALEDRSVVESVGGLLALHHEVNGTTAAYTQALLALFQDGELDGSARSILTSLLLYQTPDLNSTGVEFTESLLDALMYTDGAAREYTAHLLSQVFAQDPFMLLHQLAGRETDIQDLALSMLVCAVTGTEKIEQFTETVESLAKETTLPEAEAALADKLQEQITLANS